LAALIVLICLLNHGHHQNKEQRCQIRDKESHFQRLKELRDANQKEKHVEEVFELVE
jgi:FtsZ-interacting cell division protein ZipA